MAQPVWLTPAGSLGTIPEGVFYKIPLLAYEPETSQPVYFELIAGELPPGIQIAADGLIVGIPKAIAVVQGVPIPVSRDVTSKFAVRAYTTKVVGGVTVIDRLADRTFSITVAGQDAPQFITPAGTIATYYDGTLVTDLQIQYTSLDPADVVVVKLVAGSLPPGMSISPSGLISGYVAPNTPINATAGYSRDLQGFDEFPFDFTNRSTDATYQFILEVSDGIFSNLRTFDIVVYSRNSLTADNTQITSDNTFVTADATPISLPIILTPQGNIGTTRNDNFFAFQFTGLDPDGSPCSFVLVDPPPGLTLDPTTGWLSGYIPDLGQTEHTYNFSLRIFNTTDPAIISQPYYYNLIITGTVNTTVTWLVDSYLGAIDNGSTSLFYVRAVNFDGIELFYRLTSVVDPVVFDDNFDLPAPVYNNLPQGLTLLPSGDISGRVSFNTFALDGGTTTFDINSQLGPTTFDMVHTFTVNAYSLDNVINVVKVFSIKVIRAYNEPYENLYIECMPPLNDRVTIESLLTNTTIFSPDVIYRPTDPYFGVATNVRYDHAFGLTAATLDDYVSSLDINHYWKNLTLGSIETAQALDSRGNIIYEVVYSRIVDDLTNNNGLSVSKDVVLPYAVNPGSITEVDVVYPNSLDNMRNQVIDVVGQISNILPQWMVSKQPNGQVLGFTPAWVIAYTLPGESGQIAYNLATQFTTPLNQLDFKVDRYELDRALTYNWDPIADSSTGEWIPGASLTTFDINYHYQLLTQTSIIPGTGYKVGDTMYIPLGSSTGVNNCYLTVGQVDEFGGILVAFCSGSAELFSSGIFSAYEAINIIGTGTGARFTIRIVTGIATIFDAGSMQFTEPVDMYSTSNIHDKYLVFPRRNILG